MEKPEGWDFRRGGYVVREAKQEMQLILAATGSEVSLAVQAADLLEEQGIGVRIVSIPCAEVFYEQDADYRNSVLPDGTPIMVVEVGVSRGWYSLKPGAKISVYGLDRFGMSGPGNQVAARLGFTAEALAGQAAAFLQTK